MNQSIKHPEQIPPILHTFNGSGQIDGNSRSLAVTIGLPSPLLLFDTGNSKTAENILNQLAINNLFYISIQEGIDEG